MKYNIHTHFPIENSDHFQLINHYPKDVFSSKENYSIGIHPWYIENQFSEENLHNLFLHLKKEKCLAIGECGLDKKISVDFDLQKKVFLQQIDLAIQVNKPIIVHCVGAFQEIMELKKQFTTNIPMIFHGFSKNIQVANWLIKNGNYLSFGHHLLENPKVQHTFKNVSVECIFLETDANQSIIIDELYDKASNLLNKNVEAIIEKNFKQLFKD